MILQVPFVVFFLVYSYVANVRSNEQVSVESDEGVLVLTKDNFDNVIATSEYLLVKFYAPWCSHCKQLAPVYANVAQHLNKSKSSIKLGQVDATIESELAEKFGIRGYPTLKFFNSGKLIEYSGGLSKDEIIQWVTKKSIPETKHLQSLEHIF